MQRILLALATVLSVIAALPSVSNKEQDLDKRWCCEAKICDGLHGKGKCYKACYPVIDTIHLDDYWQHNIGTLKSAGDCSCYGKL